MLYFDYGQCCVKFCARLAALVMLCFKINSCTYAFKLVIVLLTFSPQTNLNNRIGGFYLFSASNLPNEEWWFATSTISIEIFSYKKNDWFLFGKFPFTTCLQYLHFSAFQFKLTFQTSLIVITFRFPILEVRFQRVSHPFETFQLGTRCHIQRMRLPLFVLVFTYSPLPHT